jgi:hypothetical protein
MTDNTEGNQTGYPLCFYSARHIIVFLERTA